MVSFNKIPRTDFIKPAHNVGCFFDLVTGSGEYIFGEKGNAMLNGGYVPLLSILGPQNSNKSTIARYFELSSTNRYQSMKSLEHRIKSISYDTEDSYQWTRHNRLCQNFENLKHTDWSDPGLSEEKQLFIMTNLSKLLGDEFYDLLRSVVDDIEKELSKGKRMLTTPFVQPDGKLFMAKLPTNLLIDSISMFKFSNLEDNVVDEHMIGSRETQTLAMREGGAKRQLMTDLPKLIGRGGFYTILTSHQGQEIDMGRFAQKRQKLTFSKNGTKPVGATLAFDYINGIIYEIQKMTRLKATTGVLYPGNAQDRTEGATDLVEVEVVPTRNKSGLSGQRYYVIISQREGVSANLTNFYALHQKCAQGAGFALSGDPSRTFGVIMYPGESYNRVSIRNAMDADPHLARAIEWSMLLSLYPQEFPAYDPEFFCTPQELYDDLVKLGYDWDVLRRTREYWLYKEMEAGVVPQLTCWDLLRMRKGLYTPYFLNADKTVKKEWIKVMGLDVKEEPKKE